MQLSAEKDVIMMLGVEGDDGMDTTTLIEGRNTELQRRTQWPTVTTTSWLATSTTASVSRPIPSPLQSPSAADYGMGSRFFGATGTCDRDNLQHYYYYHYDCATGLPIQGVATAKTGNRQTTYRNFGNGLHLCNTSHVSDSRDSVQGSHAWLENHANDDSSSCLADTADYIDDRLLKDLIEDFGLQQSKEDLPELGVAELLLEPAAWKSMPLMV